MTLFKQKDDLLALIRNGQPINFRQQLQLTAALSVPAFMAQISSIIMQYIDASMVGSLGANASASIGIVSTTTWLFGGMCSSLSTGFSVQVAHLIGANRMNAARSVLKQAISSAILFSSMLSIIGLCICNHLPTWLGAPQEICSESSRYFMIYCCQLPFLQLYSLSASMLRCSGNVIVPSVLGVLLCSLDVVLNFFLIFPSRSVNLLGNTFTLPGGGLGVTGAALGTALTVMIVSGIIFYKLCFESPLLRFIKNVGHFWPQWRTIKEAGHIGLPMGIEHSVMCGAQIMTTVIVAPLGTFAIAANAFAITAESICYMPGYGIGDAAITLVGQSTGAGRTDLMRRFAHITVGLGMIVMSLMGIMLYFGAPAMMGILTPVAEVRELGIEALRIEAFAEPMFAASIVAYGVFVGVGDTIIPASMNLISIWGVRLTLAAILAPKYGLNGVWTAMCIELCFRGVIFLARLKWVRWYRPRKRTFSADTEMHTK